MSILNALRGRFALAVLLYASGLVYQSYFLERTEFAGLIASVLLCFVAYFLLIWNPGGDQESGFRERKYVYWILLLIPLFSFPTLSNDYYRFIWDGELLSRGVNPYDFKPNELILLPEFSGVYFRELYDGMGSLSQENYTCYPVINQCYFLISAVFSDHIWINVVVLRILVVGTMLLGAVYLEKLLDICKLSASRSLIFLLSPLFLIEVVQNLHFEGVMISFTLMGIYYMHRQHWLLSAICWALAIHIKLLPLVLIPFWLRYLGWGKSMLLGSLTLVLTAVFALFLIDQSNYMNFLESLRLYFQQFEFNSFLLHWYIEYGRWRFGYNRIQTFGPYLSRLATMAMLVFAWLGNHFSLQQMLLRMTFALFCYYLLSSTVHPWYVLLPLVLSVFSGYRFAILWSGLIFLSYYWYVDGMNTRLFRAFTILEYGLVIVYLAYEVYVHRKHKKRVDTLPTP
ncbi:MAG: hypothetical protein EP338_14320 [Bacteroidetes bacterium]|nr:MAG: hypothetical protein EP338_14320 [Bacteroidota bacterium]